MGGRAPKFHRVDHQLVSSDDQDDQLEQVPSAVGSGKQVARRIIPQLNPSDRVGQRVLDVLVNDAMAPS